MKIAVIGAGYWGKNHVRELKNLGHTVTVCDLDEKNLDFCKKILNADFVTDELEDILTDKLTVAATVCIPNQLHFEVAKKLLTANKAVLVEKPLALSKKHCFELAFLSEKKNKVLCVGHIFRFNAAVKKLKAMIDSSELGEVFLMKFSWTNLDPIYQDRDIFSDLGVHPFDISNFLFEKNFKILGASASVFRKKKGYEVAFVSAKAGKTVLGFELSWLFPQKKREIMVVGSKKTAVVDASAQEIRLFSNVDKVPMVVQFEKNNPLSDELSNFVSCVQAGTKPIAGANVGCNVMNLVFEAQKKAR